MSTQSKSKVPAEGVINEVRLSGRVSADPVVRVLPSGDEMWTVRVVVPRVEAVPRPSGRKGAAVDVIDCVAWAPRMRRAVASWAAGDEVLVAGVLRRRFFAAAGQRVSRTEVELSSARRLRRASTG